MARKRTLYFEADFDTKGAVKGFRTMSRESGDMGSKLTSVSRGIKLALGTVATGAVASFVSNAATRSAQMEAIGDRFDTVFGDSADAVRQWADDNNEAFGVSLTKMQDMASGVQDLLVPLGFGREEAAGMTQEVLNMSNALSEWTGGQKSAEQATDAIRKALLGEREMLKEFGVALLESEVQARLAAKGLNNLTGEALAQAKAQVSLEAIMEKSTDAMTAYAAGGNEALQAQKELAAKTADLKDKVDALVGSWANAAVPALIELTEAMSTNVQFSEAFEKAFENMRKEALRGELDLDDVRQALYEMAKTGQLTETMLGQLQTATGLTDDEMVPLARDAATVALRMGELTGASRDTMLAAADLDGQLAQLHSDTLGKVISAMGLSRDAALEAEDADRKLIDAAKDAATAHGDHAKAAEEDAGKTEEAAKKIIDAAREMQRDTASEYEAMRRSIDSSLGIFDAMPERVDRSFDEVAATLRERVALEKEFAQVIARMVDAGWDTLASKFEEEGPGAIKAAYEALDNPEAAASLERTLSSHVLFALKQGIDPRNNPEVFSLAATAGEQLGKVYADAFARRTTNLRPGSGRTLIDDSSVRNSLLRTQRNNGTTGLD